MHRDCITPKEKYCQLSLKLPVASLILSQSSAATEVSRAHAAGLQMQSFGSLKSPKTHFGGVWELVQTKLFGIDYINDLLEKL